MVAKSLLEGRKVSLVVNDSCCQEGVKDQIDELYKIGVDEVVGLEVHMLSEDFIGKGGALDGVDCRLRFKLENDLRLYCWELS